MTKHLNNHHSESNNSRADKMSGHSKPKSKNTKRLINLGIIKHSDYKGIGKFTKKFYTKKRRQFLKQNIEDKI